MLRFFQSTGSSDAKGYFTEALNREDYYTKDRDIGGTWGGRGAALLGLSGPIQQAEFAALCDNRHPGSGGPLTPRTRDDRTVGYDLTFHAPKGISLLHALTGDDRIVQAMRDAIHKTMSDLEGNTHTRVRLPGPDGKPRSEDRRTGNLVWGEFTHFTSRPVGGLPDPQLHVHCYVFNATHDSVEDRWKAAQFRPVVRDHPYFQACYHTRLAANLEAIGYPVARTAHGWDLAGIERPLVKKFSRRTAQIEAAAKRLGVTDPEEKAQLGARTRGKKSHQLGADELRTRWHERMEATEAAWVERTASRALGRAGDNTPAAPDRRGPDRITAEQALDHAVAHIFARKSVESERRLLAEALRFGVGHVQPGEVQAAFDRRGDILSRTESGLRMVTTRAIVKEERAVLRFATEGRGVCRPLGAGLGGRRGEVYEIGSLSKRSGIDLNDRQRAAVEHIVSSRDRVILLRGGAGTGKTTLQREVAAAIQHGGQQIVATAITTDAARGVLREAGFRNADTLEKLLTDRKLQEQARGQVIFTDEAGMVGTPTMRRLFDLAEKLDARVILSGDTKQHAPVERGDAMRLLETRAGIRPAEVNEIVRQTGTYKQAVAAMEQGELVKSIGLLDDMGAIREMWDRHDPEVQHKELASRYMETTKGGKSALVVSPTHAEGRAVTGHIREALRESGRLTTEDRTYQRLADTQWTDAQKADPRNYEVGQIVRFAKHCPGVPARDIPPTPAGLQCEIVGVDPDRNLVTTKDAAGILRPLPLDKAERYGVYEKRDLDLARGDRIRITTNSRTTDGKRLTNGAIYGVRGFTEDGHIKLDNKQGWVIHKNQLHATHAYCSTPQAAQGKSVDVCLAAVSASPLTASTIEQLYVILSRGKQRVELITDKRSALIDAVAREHRSRSAIELMEPRAPEMSREKRALAHAREVTRLKSVESKRRERLRETGARGKRHTRQRTGRERGTGLERGRER